MIDIPKSIGGRSGNLQKLFSLRRSGNAIRKYSCKICSCCSMFFCHLAAILHCIFCRSIQSIGCNKACIFTTDLYCLFIHHISKSLYTASYMFCNCNGRIIMGFQHKRIQQILQPVFLSLSDMQLHLRHGRRIGRYFYHILQIRTLQCKN